MFEIYFSWQIPKQNQSWNCDGEKHFFLSPHQVVVYAGKPANEVGPYYIPDADESVKSLVTGLMKVCPLGGRNWTMDRLYGSVPITR